MIESRRSFLKVAAAAGTALGLTRYLEPWKLLDDQGSWVEDCGSFFILRIPAGKSFSRGQFGKPVMVLMGAGAKLFQSEFKSAVNVDFGPNGSLINDCQFDGSNVVFDVIRPLILTKGSGWIFNGCHAIAGPSNDKVMYVGTGDNITISNGVFDLSNSPQAMSGFVYDLGESQPPYIYQASITSDSVKYLGGPDGPNGKW